MAALRGGAVSYERGTPVPRAAQIRETLFSQLRTGLLSLDLVCEPDYSTVGLVRRLDYATLYVTTQSCM